MKPIVAFVIFLVGLTGCPAPQPQAGPAPTATDLPRAGLATPPPAPVIRATTGISDARGGYMPPGTSQKIADWWGVIKRTTPGAQYDDFFERRDLGQVITFGIDASDPVVQAQIQALRDSGKIVHLYGTLFSNAPDDNGSQIKVDRIEVER